MRQRASSPLRDSLLVVGTGLATLLAIYQLFNLGRLTGWILIDNEFAYLLLAFLLPLVFILFPWRPTARPETRIAWADLALAVLTFGLLIFLAWNGETIVRRAWEYTGPEHTVWISLGIWAVLLEGARRAGGWPVFFVVLVLSAYPVFADDMPGVFEGLGMTLDQAAMFHAMSQRSMLGLPMQAFAQLVFGFLIFGVALQFTGAGRFFIDFAFALLGTVRGGAAKVAVFSSGLMGSMSGSVTSNVLTTGSVTIPTMRKSGFPRLYAAAIEACASTGGTLMPPIMGATAFLMANILQVPYVEVAIAALIPSLLYFFGLFMQVDGYAARNDLKGLPRHELPRLIPVLKEGWYFIAVFAVLIYMLVVMQRESTAPYWATLLLLAINQFSRRDRMNWAKLRRFLVAAGTLVVEIAAILAAIGLVVGALTSTGMVGTLTNDLISIAGDNLFLLLLMGAATSFILGIGLTVTIAYVLLAVVLAPALIRGGFDPMAVHMFILYWGMLSFITPPVAIGAFAAASVAGTDPMRTGVAAMRKASIIYIVPFFFVLNPALLMQGAPMEIAIVFVTALAGVVLVAAGLEGWLFGVGRVEDGPLGAVLRLMLVGAGILLLAPGQPELGLEHWHLVAAGLALTGLVTLRVMATRKAVSGPAATAPTPTKGGSDG